MDLDIKRLEFHIDLLSTTTATRPEMFGRALYVVAVLAKLV